MFSIFLVFTCTSNLDTYCNNIVKNTETACTNYPQVHMPLKTGLPIKRYATQLYTRAMFDRFSRELFLWGSYEIRNLSESGLYEVYYIHDDENTSNVQIHHTVGCSPDGMYFYCDCKMFEHSGIPCHHTIKVINEFLICV